MFKVLPNTRGLSRAPTGFKDYFPFHHNHTKSRSAMTLAS